MRLSSTDVPLRRDYLWVTNARWQHGATVLARFENYFSGFAPAIFFVEIHMKNKNIIGVIGGMGPYASVDFYRLLIEGARYHYGAKNNDEYPEVIVDSIPVPDFLSDKKRMEEAAQILEDRTRRLSNFGATIITMVCNTACILRDRLEKVTRQPFIFVVDEVSDAVAIERKKVLILASPSTLRFGLYQKALTKRGVEFIIPEENDYQELEDIIRSVIADKYRTLLMRKLVRLVTHYRKNRDVCGIVLGCTELPLVFPNNYNLPVYNSLSILANSLLRRYYGGRHD